MRGVCQYPSEHWVHPQTACMKKTTQCSIYVYTILVYTYLPGLGLTELNWIYKIDQQTQDGLMLV